MAMALMLPNNRPMQKKRTAIEPSPTADEIPVKAVDRTSPHAKIPGIQVSGSSGSRLSFQKELKDFCFINSPPVIIYPLLSFKMLSPNQNVPGFAPM